MENERPKKDGKGSEKGPTELGDLDVSKFPLFPILPPRTPVQEWADDEEYQEPEEEVSCLVLSGPISVDILF